MNDVLFHESGTVKCINNADVEEYLTIGKEYHAQMTGINFPMPGTENGRTGLYAEMGAVYFVDESDDGKGHDFKYNRFELIKKDPNYRVEAEILAMQIEKSKRETNKKSFWRTLFR